MLQLSQIHWQRASKTLLNIDHMHLQAGQMVALLGANGAGKSTLLGAICGDIAVAGQRQLHGRELQQWPSRELARHLAVLPQSSQLTFPFQAQEVVAMGLTPLSLNRAEGQRAIEQTMRQTDCWHLAQRLYPKLSGGERQRVQLARVLLQLSQAEKPPLLLLDEPTSAQDLGQQHHLLKLLQSLSQSDNYLVIAILHDLNQVLRYCNQCCLLEQGHLVGYGAPEQLLTPATVAKHWQYQPEQLQHSTGAMVLI